MAGAAIAGAARAGAAMIDLVSNGVLRAIGAATAVGPRASCLEATMLVAKGAPIRPP